MITSKATPTKNSTYSAIHTSQPFLVGPSNAVAMQEDNPVTTPSAFLDLEGNGRGENDRTKGISLFSPLEILLMVKSDLTTVQEIYHAEPSALTLHTLHRVCYHGAQPGVISFLAERLPSAVSV